MRSHPIRTWRISVAVSTVTLMASLVVGGAALAQAGARHGGDALAEVAVGQTVQLDNACYARLPDMPRGLYGGFGGYNAQTGVLTFAGGAEKRTEENTIAYYHLYALKLDGQATQWSMINYGANVGYLRESDRGCREMASVQTGDNTWASVAGKDGCDGTSDRWGDIKELQIGTAASAAQVRWVANSGVDQEGLPQDLQEGKFRLARVFATWDSQRNRIVFGQGTYDDALDQETQDKVYQATRRGNRWSVSQLRPGGTAPAKRFGACAAYVYDQDQGVDGVIVLGGQQGGPVGTTSYKEVWWLSFAKGAGGEWVDITSRFANMDDIGFRREGACAYDAQTKTFYSWMGRADDKIADGAKRSSGLWRVSLAQLGDTNAALTWERVSKDKQAEPAGRRLIPSVWDAANRRFFAIGGRNDLNEWADVWAIYPDVTGDACTNLDVYAPFRPGVATPTATTPGGTTPGTPVATATLRPTATTPPPPPVQACAFLTGLAPAQAIQDAVANASRVAGYGMLCNPNLAASPYNTQRTNLSLQNPNKAWHPLYNGFVWSCGCP